MLYYKVEIRCSHCRIIFISSCYKSYTHFSYLSFRRILNSVMLWERASRPTHDFDPFAVNSVQRWLLPIIQCAGEWSCFAPVVSSVEVSSSSVVKAADVVVLCETFSKTIPAFQRRDCTEAIVESLDPKDSIKMWNYRKWRLHGSFSPSCTASICSPHLRRFVFDPTQVSFDVVVYLFIFQ